MPSDEYNRGFDEGERDRNAGRGARAPQAFAPGTPRDYLEGYHDGATGTSGGSSFNDWIGMNSDQK